MKDTLKTLELLEQHIDRVVENGLYEIERDLLLERLRGIYATVVATEAIAEEERVLDALISIGATTPLLAEEEPEIEIERIYAEEEEDYKMQNEEAEIVAPEPETKSEIAVESEPVVAEEEPTTESEPEPVVAEEEPSTEDEELTVVYKEEDPADDEELDHEAVMALYDDDDESDDEEQPAEEEEVIPAAIEEDVAEEEEPESISEPEPTDEEPAEEAVDEDIEEEVPVMDEPQTVVLGDILASEQTTIADNLAEQMVADVASAAGANASLRSSIALNDKFILMRDLFAGNNDYYEMAIERLDSFDNLEEAMLYIHDTFHWNPNSEGARLLMELLARKLF